jgi:ABC-type antimicrobial peptide transport system permease subunit
LASVGLYGVVSYAVSRRTREIGIRVALGAHGDDVVGMVIREGLVPTGLGLVLGLAGALAGGRALDALLYGVQPNDPATMAAVTVILLAVAFAATFLPARRASRIPPSSALRVE